MSRTKIIASILNAVVLVVLVTCMLLAASLSIAAYTTTKSIFAEYEFIAKSLNANPIVNITLIISSATCATGYYEINATIPINTKWPRVVSIWRGKRIFVQHGNVSERPESCGNSTSMCAYVTCLSPCQMNTLSVSSSVPTLDLAMSTEIQIYPIAEIIMTNETLILNCYKLIDSIPELDMFAWTSIPLTRAWNMYYANEPTFSSMCNVTRADIVNYGVVIGIFQSTQLASFIIVMLLTLLVAFIPVSRFAIAKLRIKSTANAFEQYCRRNLLLWKEYVELWNQTPRNSVEFGVPQQNLPIHLHELQELYNNYDAHRFATLHCKCWAAHCSIAATVLSILAYTISIVVVYYTVQVRDFFQLVSQQPCGYGMVHNMSHSIATTMTGTAVWMHITELVLYGVMIPLTFVVGLRASCNLAHYMRHSRERSVEFKLSRVIPIQ